VWGAVSLLALASQAHARDLAGWLPEAASVEATEIDFLIDLVTVVTGVTLIGVQALMVLFLIKYRARPGRKATHTHGNHTVEMIWTIAPALLLVFLALFQMNLWVKVKSATPQDNADPVPVQIFAKQFEWNFRYQGPDGEFGTKDDLVTVKELVLPVNRPMNAEMRSMDVLHSFFLPNFRFKNDAVPGVPMKIWQRPSKLSKDREPVKDRDGKMVQLDYWDIVCAELCGLGHTTMSAKLYVVTQDEFDRWLAGEQGVVPAIHQPVYLNADGTVDAGSIWSRWPDQDRRNEVPAPAKWHRGFPFGPDYKGESEDAEDDF
jgi:cytochrome c oxidase subunit 2